MMSDSIAALMQTTLVKVAGIGKMFSLPVFRCFFCLVFFSKIDRDLDSQKRWLSVTYISYHTWNTINDNMVSNLVLLNPVHFCLEYF